MIIILPFVRDTLPYDITISLTNDCNLACPYCYVQKAKTYMNFETGKQCVDYAYNNLTAIRNKYQDIMPYLSFTTQDRLKSTIFFFGGEPLLNFKVLKQIVEYAITTYPNDFYFVLTTNGILLNDKICQFFKDYDIDVTVSCDGIKEDQDKQRPFGKSKVSSYDILIQKIQLLKKYDLLSSIMVRMTATIDNISHFYEDYLLFEELGFGTFAFDLEYFSNWTEDKLLILKEELHKVYEHRFNQYLNNETPKIKFLLGDNTLLEYFKGQLEILCNIPVTEEIPKIYNNCGYGLEMICVNGHGNFYPCHEEPDFFEAQFSNCIGNFKDGVDYEKLNNLRENIKAVEEKFLSSRTCVDNCILKQYHIPCYYTSCPANLYQTQRISSYNCELRKYCLEYIIYYGSQLIELQNKPFLEKINQLPSVKVYQDILSQPEGLLRNWYIEQYKQQMGAIRL